MSVDKFLKQYAKAAGQVDKKKFPVPGYEPCKALVPSTGLLGVFGIELEVEGLNLPTGVNIQQFRGKDTNCYWQSKEDGSLRGEAYEYVLSTPCSLEEAQPMLEHIWKKLTVPGTRVNHSNRTSSHVHINIQGMKLNELSSYVILWSLFEEALIQWCGYGRTSNHFCLGNKDTNYWLVNAWTSALENGLFKWGEGHSKYSALNLACINTLGSFEFRCMRGMESIEQILEWCKILYALREAAKDEFRMPLTIARRASELGATDMFRDILTRYGSVSDETINQIITPSFREDCMSSLRECQSIIYAFNWREWEEEFYKVYVENPFAIKAKKGRNRIRHGVDLRWAEVGPLNRMELDEIANEVNIVDEEDDF